MLSFSVREAREFATHYKLFDGGDVELIKLGHCEKCNSPYVEHRDRMKLKSAVLNYLHLEKLQDNISDGCQCTPNRKPKTIEEFKNPFDATRVLEIRKIAHECITDSIALFAKCMCYYRHDEMEEVLVKMQGFADDISNEICARQ